MHRGHRNSSEAQLVVVFALLAGDARSALWGLAQLGRADLGAVGAQRVAALGDHQRAQAIDAALAAVGHGGRYRRSARRARRATRRRSASRRAVSGRTAPGRAARAPRAARCTVKKGRSCPWLRVRANATSPRKLLSSCQRTLAGWSARRWSAAARCSRARRVAQAAPRAVAPARARSRLRRNAWRVRCARSRLQGSSASPSGTQVQPRFWPGAQPGVGIHEAVGVEALGVEGAGPMGGEVDVVRRGPARRSVAAEPRRGWRSSPTTASSVRARRTPRGKLSSACCASGPRCRGWPRCRRR